MKKDYGQILLQNKEIHSVLKEMILEKSERYNEVSKLLIGEKTIDQLLQGIITQHIIRMIVSHYEAQEELTQIERDLSAMCYQLNKACNNLPGSSSWEQAYLYATQTARIDTVVSSLTGITDFKRNINCPFHKDKSPSLKVYAKNNRFVCFSCNARGSPIDFVMQYKNCSFREAVMFLSNF